MQSMGEKIKAVIIFGAGRNQLPYIMHFKQLGMRVISIDRDAKAIGFANTDIPVVCSTHNSEGILKKINELPEKKSIIAIVCPTSGFPYIAASRCAEALNLPFLNENSAQQLVDKYLFGKSLIKSKLSNRKVICIDNIDAVPAKINFPLVIKPRRGGGGHKSVKICYHQKQLYNAFQNAQRASSDGLVIIESYAVGEEIKIGGFLQNGHLKLLIIAKRINGEGEPGLPIGLITGPYPDKNEESLNLKYKISDYIESLCSKLKIKDAFLNIDIILTSTGAEAIDIDITMGSFQYLIPAATGIDAISAYGDLYLKKKLELKKKYWSGAAVVYLWCYAENINTNLLIDVCMETIGEENFITNPTLPLILYSKDEPVHIGCLIIKDNTQNKTLRKCLNSMNKIQQALGIIFNHKAQIAIPSDNGIETYMKV